MEKKMPFDLTNLICLKIIFIYEKSKEIGRKYFASTVSYKYFSHYSSKKELIFFPESLISFD